MHTHFLHSEQGGGGFDQLSASAASSSSRSRVTPVSGRSPMTSNSPRVSVPVLSNTTQRVSARASMPVEPLSSTPRVEAPPMPPKKPSGTEITSAQGQLMTRKVSAFSM